MKREDTSLHIEAGEETRHREYKQSQSWDDKEFRAKIVRSILAMANTPDGGAVVIGMRQDDDGSFLKDGIDPEHRKTLGFEEMRDWVDRYADPFADFSIRAHEEDGKSFLIITVREFDQHPVICKRDGPSGLEKGAIFVRTRNRRPESARIPDHVHLRELIDRAIDKGERALRARGYVRPEETAETEFDAEIKDLEQ